MWQVLVLAICKKLKWQEPWQESGTCHFFYEKVARTVARTMFKLYEDMSDIVLIALFILGFIFVNIQRKKS